MRRMTRRTVAILGGIVLGWYAAGFLPGSLSQSAGPSPLFAVDAPDHDGHREGDALHGEAGQAHTAHDAAERGAQLLVPKTSDEVCWYSGVLWASGGLFAGAVVLGYPALRLRGPEPEAAQDDHGDH